MADFRPARDGTRHHARGSCRSRRGARLALATLYSFSKLLPTAKTYFNNDTVASIVVVAGVFVGTLIVVSVITVRISDMILDSGSARWIARLGSCLDWREAC
jgi:uncharacterized membrane protein required for colicin V production